MEDDMEVTSDDYMEVTWRMTWRMTGRMTWSMPWR